MSSSVQTSSRANGAFIFVSLIIAASEKETYVRVELGAVVLVVVGAVHWPVAHGDDPGTSRSVLRPVGLLRSQGHTHVLVVVSCLESSRGTFIEVGGK